jgi:hypothetical protein
VLLGSSQLPNKRTPSPQLTEADPEAWDH